MRKSRSFGSLLYIAQVAELVYAYDSESYPARVGGSNPLLGTLFRTERLKLALVFREDFTFAFERLLHSITEGDNCSDVVL